MYRVDWGLNLFHEAAKDANLEATDRFPKSMLSVCALQEHARAII